MTLGYNSLLYWQQTISLLRQKIYGSDGTDLYSGIHHRSLRSTIDTIKKDVFIHWSLKICLDYLPTCQVLFALGCHFYEWHFQTNGAVVNSQFTRTLSHLQTGGIHHPHAGHLQKLSEVTSVCWIGRGTCTSPPDNSMRKFTVPKCSYKRNKMKERNWWDYFLEEHHSLRAYVLNLLHSMWPSVSV